MKKTLITVALSSAALLSSTFSHAADVGIGVSVQTTTAEIRFPIKLSDSFMMEPFLYYEVEKDPNQGHDTTDNIAGSGFYYLNSIHEDLRMLAGIRLGAGQFEVRDYYDGKYTTQITMINPLIGFEYFFDDHVSIGADAGIFYYELEDGESLSSTDTNLIARFYF